MGDNICKSYIQVLLFRIYRELLKLINNNNKKHIQKKWANKDLLFLQKDIQMVSKYIKRYSTYLIIKEMKIKTLPHTH